MRCKKSKPNSDIMDIGYKCTFMNAEQKTGKINSCQMKNKSTYVVLVSIPNWDISFLPLLWKRYAQFNESKNEFEIHHRIMIAFIFSLYLKYCFTLNAFKSNRCCFCGLFIISFTYFSEIEIIIPYFIAALHVSILKYIF